MYFKKIMFHSGISVSIGVLISFLFAFGVNYYQKYKTNNELNTFEVELRNNYQYSLENRILLLKNNLTSISNTKQLAEKKIYYDDDKINNVQGKNSLRPIVNKSHITKEALENRILLYDENIKKLKEIIDELIIEKEKNSSAVAKLHNSKRTY